MNANTPKHIPEEIEARITAMLLGELTAAEQAEVRRAIEGNPELGQLHERLKRAIELVREAVAQPAEIAVAHQTLPQMSEERRQKLLQRFKTPTPKELSPPPRGGVPWIVPMSIAAVLMALLTLGGLVLWNGNSGGQPQAVTLLPSLSKTTLTRLAESEVRRRSLAAAKDDLATRPGGVDQGERGEVARTASLANRPPAGQNYFRSQANADKAGEIGPEAKPSAESERIVAQTAMAPRPVEMFRRYGLPGGPPNVATAPDANREAGNALDWMFAPAKGGAAHFEAGKPVAPGVIPLDTIARRIDAAVSQSKVEFFAPSLLDEKLSRGASANTASGVGGGGGAGLDGRVQAEKVHTPALAINATATPAQQADVFSVNAVGMILTEEEARDKSLVMQAVKQNQERVDFAKALSSEGKKGPQLGEVEKDKLAKRPLAELRLRSDLPAPANGVDNDGDALADAGRHAAKEAKALPFNGTVDDGIQAGAVKRTPPPEPQAEVLTEENAFSTFSLNVTDVSFKLAAASLEKGDLPEPAAVRSEEFINAFNYRDPEPARGVPVAFAWARAQYPYAHNRDLVRFAVQTAARGRDAGRPLNLVLLLDNSGSMERADRVRIIREALVVLGLQLQARDRISVVAFARSARLWVDALPGDKAGELAERVGNLPPEGGTNLEEALNLAYATAARHFLSEGVNRVVLLTDGAANLGDVDPESLQRKVESWRHRGVALDCFGIGWEGYNDDLLEVLSRNGDGRYGFVNRPEDASTEFAAQLAGALQVAASDVKVQVEFNPRRVAAWRQLGYAKHQLTKEQFRDNAVDAAELAAAESGNALYVIQVDPHGTGPIGLVRVRYREPDSGIYREHEWPVPYTGAALPLDRAPASLRLAATASAFSEWLVSSPFAGEVTPDRLLNYLQGVPAAFEPDPRPQKLEWMIRQAKSISGK